MVSMSETGAGLTMLTSTETVTQLKEIMKKSSVMMMRVLELVVKVSQLSEDHLQRMDKTGMLSQLVDILASNDFLLQLNSVELLTQLAITSHGQLYLETAGVMTTLATLLQDCHNMPFAQILIPGIC